MELKPYKLHHKLYSVWWNMIDRCTNTKNPSWKSYGGKGVSVCIEWKESFMEFYNWAITNGYEDGLQIDKDIMGDGKLYSPQMCIWVTPKVNNDYSLKKFRIYEYNGGLYSMKQLSKIVGINPTTLGIRINKMGMTVQEAIDFTFNKIVNKNKKKVLKNRMSEKKIRRFASYGTCGSTFKGKI